MSFWQCGCCCPTIGFDRNVWPAIAACCTGMSPYLFLASDLTPLSQCKVVFAGLVNCGESAIFFSSGQYATIKAYIEAGGRFWLNTEHGEQSPGDPGACMPAIYKPTVNAFLSSLGSTISYVGDRVDNNCSTTGSRDCIVGAANIAQGLTVRMAASAKLSGGTNVLKSPSGFDIVQVEQLGAGFLFVCGDANISLMTACGYNNCSLFDRIWSYADADIL